MLSIITAVHNQLPMNKLFIQSLKKYTHYPYELIIVDNNSTDGSREFFKDQGAVIITNKSNYSYPVCQNQGIKIANYDNLIFFNNDIIVSPNWDMHLLNILGKNGYEVVSFATPDRGANLKETQRQSRGWKRVKYPLLRLLDASELSLKLMLKLKYRNWESFCKKKYEEYGYHMIEGFSGSVIAMTRAGLGKVGYWDERMQDADFDLYMRSKERFANCNDIQPLSIISGIFMHHYGRLTLKSSKKPAPFSDAHNLISFKSKWKITMKELAKTSLKQQ